MTASIYDVICAALGGSDRLPEGYELPHEPTAPNEVRFMAGAKDGIGVFHTSRQSVDDAVSGILGYLRSGETDKIAPIIADTGTLTIIDSLIDAIQEAGDLDAGLVRRYAESLAFDSDNQEQVKLGIALLGLLDLDVLPSDQDKLVKLGLCEEFTLYVVVAAARWKHGEYIIWHLAMNTDGWGKIHAVTRLEPVDEEIRDWLLRHGCTNTVMDAYLGLKCATKGDLIEALRCGHLDAELFDGICVIMDAMADEGPAAGFSAYDHTDEALARFLTHAENEAHTLTQLWHILNVKNAVDDMDLADKDSLLEQFDRIEAMPQWREIIESAVSDPEGDLFLAANVARRVGIDVSAQLLAAVKADPIENSWAIAQCFRDPGAARELTELYEQVLPLADMASGMGDYHFSPTHGQECLCLDQLLQALQDYPLLGESLVATGLMSPVVRNRNMACGVLEAWSAQLNRPVRMFSPSLHSTLSQVATAEIKDKPRERMTALLVTP